jgi:hypothetical protein
MSEDNLGLSREGRNGTLGQVRGASESDHPGREGAQRV